MLHILHILHMSKQTPLTLNEKLATNDFLILCVIICQFCMRAADAYMNHQARNLSDCRCLLSSKYFKREVKIIFSKFCYNWSGLIQFGSFVYLLVTFFMIWDNICFFFPFIWKTFITILKRICRHFEIDVTRNFNIHIKIPSRP